MTKHGKDRFEISELFADERCREARHRFGVGEKGMRGTTRTVGGERSKAEGRGVGGGSLLFSFVNSFVISYVYYPETGKGVEAGKQLLYSCCPAPSSLPQIPCVSHILWTIRE